MEEKSRDRTDAQTEGESQELKEGDEVFTFEENEKVYGEVAKIRNNGDEVAVDWKSDDGAEFVASSWIEIEKLRKVED